MTTNEHRGRQRVEIDLARVEELAGRGLTQSQIADCLGINKATFYRRKAENSEFCNALKRGKARGIERATARLFSLIEKGDLGAICFYLKCQAGWTDKQVIDHTSSDGSMSQDPPKITLQIIDSNGTELDHTMK